MFYSGHTLTFYYYKTEFENIEFFLSNKCYIIYHIPPVPVLLPNILPDTVRLGRELLLIIQINTIELGNLFFCKF